MRLFFLSFSQYTFYIIVFIQVIFLKLKHPFLQLAKLQKPHQMQLQKADEKFDSNVLHLQNVHKKKYNHAQGAWTQSLRHVSSSVRKLYITIYTNILLLLLLHDIHVFFFFFMSFRSPFIVIGWTEETGNEAA